MEESMTAKTQMGHVTRQSTKKTQKNIQKLELYFKKNESKN